MVSSADSFSLESIGETVGFDRVLAAGVLIYLNDDQLNRALDCIRDVLAGDEPRVVFREPVAVQQRLSIIEHYSTDLDAEYNAIYRTRNELMDAFAAHFRVSGLNVIEQGVVFGDDRLNNRAETRQEWFVVGRAT